MTYHVKLRGANLRVKMALTIMGEIKDIEFNGCFMRSNWIVIRASLAYRVVIRGGHFNL